MTSELFRTITAAYPSLTIVVLGDFCLDRYLEIDPARQEISIETGLPVHNVSRVRSQPGAAGTIVSNLAALGIGRIFAVGFAGHDGEGYELWHALEALPGVRLDHFIRTVQQRTFTYCKPLMMTADGPPVELNRLDLKNWSPTPALLQGLLVKGLQAAARDSAAVIVMDQVDVPETGVMTQKVLAALKTLAESRTPALILADSRRSLRGYPPLALKMNATELASLVGASGELDLAQVKETAGALAAKQGRPVFVTLAERGMIAAAADGSVAFAPALPSRGPVDIVGAGDAVTANLTAALAAGAGLEAAVEMANAAASVVIHKLGTTGTASVQEIEQLVCA